jgi:hypothetical protein
MAKDFEDYYRAEEAKNPMTQEERARDKANRKDEKRMLAEESKRLKDENKPEFKASVEKAIRGGGGGGGMRPDTDITASKKLPKMAKGGSVSTASRRADGCATKGKTKGRMV